MSDQTIRVRAMTLEDHMLKVDRSAGPDACWPWTGSQSSLGYRERKGYGSFRMNGIAFRAHRVAWELANGQPVPAGLFVCHHCDNPPCCNPAHLFVGNAFDNMRDMARKGRWRSRSSRGHLNPLARLTEADIPLIRADPRSRSVVAAAWGVSKQTIQDIQGGRTWSYVEPHTLIKRPKQQRRLTPEIVASCRQRHAAGEATRKLARDLGVDAKTMRYAIKGLSWKN